ncbi:hypothetical protein CBL_20814 [Carabus blaptoides fortunei]
MPRGRNRISTRVSRGAERPVVSIIEQATSVVISVSRPITANDVPAPEQGTDFQAWINENTDLSDENCEDVEEYETLNQHHVQAIWGLISCFLGRNLTTDNATQWITRRKQAFANACGTDAGDIAYNASLPSQQFATNTYSSVQPRFEIRRALFQQLRGRSKTKDSFSSAAQDQTWPVIPLVLRNFCYFRHIVNH